MYNEKCNIEVITVGDEIIVYGLNLQSSGLPISFQSLGVMWDRYTEDMKKSTPNRVDNETEYAVCLNKVPDYIVGVEINKIQEAESGFMSFIIPTGKYVKVEFNGENHQDMVDTKLMARQKEAKEWAKNERLKLNKEFTVEVYPKQTVEMEHPEMYCLFPIL